MTALTALSGSNTAENDDEDDLPVLSVVVPCYNEAENLRELWQRTQAACRKAVGEKFEIILVNDGSKDVSWAIIRMLADQNSHVVAVNLSRHHGHQLALTAGLSVTQGERVLILDADLQDPPELLEPMMEMMDDGADIVYGQRQQRHGETWFKRKSAQLFYRVLEWLVDIPIPMNTGDFRLVNRRTLNILNKMPERHRFIRGMVSWIGLKQMPLAYERQARFGGRTKYSLDKMVRLAVDAITGFSIVPLRLASYAGLVSGFAAIALLVYALGAWMANATVAGWTSLMVVILAIGSIQLLSLGVFGEYLGRLYMESKQRPLFVIDEIIRGEKNKPAVMH